MTVRALRTLLFTIVASLAVASPAPASLASEVTAGRQIAQQVDAGKAGCDGLKAADFEHLGEYAMERMVGSRAAHAAMDARMESMVGQDAAERMHELMGRRYAGCAAAGAGAGAGMMMGRGMMGAGGAAMMGSSSLTWMRDGTWRHMSRGDWQQVRDSWMGPGMMGRGNHHGWSWLAIVAIVLGALAVGALVAAAIFRYGWRDSNPHGQPATRT